MALQTSPARASMEVSCAAAKRMSGASWRRIESVEPFPVSVIRSSSKIVRIDAVRSVSARALDKALGV